MAGIALFAVLIALAAVVLWAIRTTPAPKAGTQTDTTRNDSTEAAWGRAMAKAGVEATYPAEPVPVMELSVDGRHQFEAVFTAEEISAIINTYRYETRFAGRTVSISEATVAFPEADTAAIEGELLLDGTAYSASAEAPLTYNAKGLSSPGLTSLSVEGFGVGDARRDQAGQALLAYFNLFLWDAPGLTLDSARITEAGIEAKGMAPDRLGNPAPSVE